MHFSFHFKYLYMHYIDNLIDCRWRSEYEAIAEEEPESDGEAEHRHESLSAREGAREEWRQYPPQEQHEQGGHPT